MSDTPCTCPTCGFTPCACILRSLFADRIGLLRTAAMIPAKDREGIAKPIADDLMDRYDRTTEAYNYWLGVLVPDLQGGSDLARFIVGDDAALKEAWSLLFAAEVAPAIALAGELREKAARVGG